MTHPKSHEGINQSQAFTAKDRLLHMKKKDNQSTGSNSKQWTPKWLLRQRRKKHKEKSEFRDVVKEAAAVKPVLMLEITLQCPSPSHGGKKKTWGSLSSCSLESGVQHSGWNSRNHTSSVQAWVISLQYIHHQGDDATEVHLKTESTLSPTGRMYTEML